MFVFVWRVIVHGFTCVRDMSVFMCKSMCECVGGWSCGGMFCMRVCVLACVAGACAPLSDSACMHVCACAQRAHVTQCLIKACALLVLSQTGQMKP